MCLLAVLLGACGSGIEPLLVSTPNALHGTPVFAVLAVDYSHLFVGEEPAAEYLGRKDQGQQRSFTDDSLAVDVEFRGRLRELLGPAAVDAPGPRVFTLRPVLERWEPGAWFIREAEARLVLSVLDDRGREVERVRLTAQEVANVFHPSSGDRMRSCARTLADRAARYLTDRSLK